MTGFQKAVARIEGEAARNGGYPDEIDLTLYDERSFAHFHPGESFDDYQCQRAALVAWCRDHGIKVVDQPVTHRWPRSAAGRARRAVAKHRRYRLGINMHGSTGGFRRRGESPTGDIGWFMVYLDHVEGGED